MCNGWMVSGRCGMMAHPCEWTPVRVCDMTFPMQNDRVISHEVLMLVMWQLHIHTSRTLYPCLQRLEVVRTLRGDGAPLWVDPGSSL